MKPKSSSGSGFRIAVIADTHGHMPEPAFRALAAADEIWHLGDFCDASTLSACQKIGPPFHAVLGNNDYGLDLPQRLVLERAGHACLLIHIPPIPPAGNFDFLLHGHTHVPRDDFDGRTRWLNPGSLGKPDKGAPASFAWLTLEGKRPPAWRVVRL